MRTRIRKYHESLVLRYILSIDMSLILVIQQEHEYCTIETRDAWKFRHDLQHLVL